MNCLNTSLTGILLSMALAFSAHRVSGQELMQYKGPYEVAGYRGDVTLGYYVIEGDTLLQGPFRMQHSDLDALLKRQDSSYSFTGAFRDGTPQGPWEFIFGMYRTDSLTEMAGYQYSLKVSGTREESRGELVNGKPHGLWEQSVDRITDSEVEKTLFQSRITYDNGVPRQNIRVAGERTTLVGRFLRNGLAHDEWVLFSEDGIEPVEKWIFREGLLESVEILQGEGMVSEEIFKNYPGLTQEVALDAGYLAAVSWWRTGNTPVPSGSIGMLLAENARYYDRINTIFSGLGNETFEPGFRARLPFSPMDATEVLQAGMLDSLSDSLQVLSRELLDNPHLNIIRRSDREAAFLYAATDSLHKKFVLPVARLADLGSKGVLEYLNRNTLADGLWPEGKPGPRIPVVAVPGETGQTQVFSGPGAGEQDFSGGDLNTVLKIAEYAKSCLLAIHEDLQGRLAMEMRQQEQLALEASLVSQLNGLNGVIDSLQVGAPGPVAESLEAIRGQADSILTAFSNYPDRTALPESSQNPRECLDHLELLARSVGALPEREKEIAQAFTDAVWNPFTATVMDESVKKRITVAYREVLVPYVLRRVRTGSLCGTAQQWSDFIDAAYQEVLRMRDRDTDRLERKLRRQKDPETVIGLLGLELPQTGR